MQPLLKMPPPELSAYPEHIALLVPGAAANAAVAERSLEDSALTWSAPDTFVPQLRRDAVMACLLRTRVHARVGESVRYSVIFRPNDVVVSWSRSENASSLRSTFLDTPDETVDDSGLDNPLYRDAVAFGKAVKSLSWRPSVHMGDGEIVFEWISDDKHAVVSVEGDGIIGYTYLVDGQFVSGAEVGASPNAIPSDLREYLAYDAAV